MGRTRTARNAVAVLLVTVVMAAPAAAEPGSAAAVLYRPPVAGPVIDPFRQPSNPYGPGNRGLDYATTPGEPVGAAADGIVTFAGPVGGGLHVVLLHRDGIRTSLSFLASILVVRGQQVPVGGAVGLAGATVHLGARRGEVYLDPATLFVAASSGTRSVLVPDGPERPLGVDEEAAGLRRLLAGIAARATPPGAAVLSSAALSSAALSSAARAAASRSAAELAVLVRTAATAGAPPAWLVLAAVASTLAEQGPCSPPGSPPPPRPVGRRLLVLVGGLGSSSRAAAIFDLDVASLGYGPADVVRFSYRGGSTGENPYDPDDTFGGIEVPAARLAALLARFAAAHPGRPVDIVAHSMGGLVARAALALRGPGAVPAPATLVTLGTPHGGADLAAVARLSSATAAGRILAEGMALTPAGLAPASRSVADLAPGSRMLARLAASPPPGPPTRVAAVGARTDLVVPPPDARWPGVPSTTVDLPFADPRTHGQLPGSAAATREVALAVGGAPPTCRSQREALGDAAFGFGVRTGTYGIGAAATVGLGGMLPVGPVPVPLRGP